MAWTEAVAGFKDMQIVLVSKDGRNEKVIDTFPAGVFQATFADGFNANNAVRLAQSAIALGCRGEKLSIRATHAGKIDISETDATNCIAFGKLVDLQNVTPNAQLAYYAQSYNHPWKPDEGIPITQSELNAVICNEYQVANSVNVAATTKDLGGDSRWVLKDDDAARTSLNSDAEFATMTPGASDVVILPAGSIVNLDIDTFGS